MRRQRQRQPRHGQARALHQCVRRQWGGRLLLDLPGGGHAEKRVAGGAGDSLHGLL
jgi:hypothetical protein